MRERLLGPNSFRPLLIRALILPLVLVIAFAGILLWQVTRLISTSAWVDHTDRVIAEANELRALHSDLQTGVRGYLITMDPIFRAPFDTANPLVDPAFAALSQLISDNPPQVQRLHEIHGLKDRWLAYVEQEMLDRKSGGPWQAEVKAGTGRQLMDEIRDRFVQFIGTEQTLRDQRSRTAKQSALLSLWLTGGMAILLGVALALISRQHLHMLVDTYGRALAAANESADELERKVAQRTADLADANARLHDLAAERERAAAALELMNGRLESSNRELQDFASVASHDLQEPLRKVQAFGDRLKERCGPALGEEGSDYLSRMQNAAGRMKSLINDLLTFARVTSRARPFAPVDLALVTRQVISDLEARIEDTKARVTVGDLPVIDADVTQMRQVIQNLIGNGLKFAKADQPPEIFVDATVDDAGPASMVRLSVRDNGIGFDEKYNDRIFTIFQRLHGRDEYEGTGIGLAVCRKIADRHGGTIIGHSRPGDGATFIVTLPLRQSTAAPLTPVAVEEGEPGSMPGAA